MPFKCWPESYTMARHWTNARYIDTFQAIPCIPTIPQHDALNQGWVNAGSPSVMLAHIERGAKHEELIQYWVNVG